MTAADVAALTLSILAGLAAVISALTALLQAYRVHQGVADVQRQLNGRLDQLMREREERLRAQALLDVVRSQSQSPSAPPTVERGEPIIRPMRPDHRKEDES